MPHQVIHWVQGLGFPLVEVDGHGGVDEDDFGAVGGPLRVVAPAGAELGQYFFFAGSVCGTDGEFVFAGAVGEVGDEASVGRPSGHATRGGGVFGVWESARNS